MDKELVEKLGEEFALVLKEWLTNEEWTEMRVLNRGERNDWVCHSHDHCDANMAMAQAFENLRVKTSWDLRCELPEPVTYEAEQELEKSAAYNQSIDLWNAAWDYAKAKHLTADDYEVKHLKNGML